MNEKINKKPKIIATIGLAKSNGSRAKLKKMMEAGLDVARINFAHAKYSEVEAQIAWIRELSKEMRQKVMIYADLSGPKIRLGKLDGIVEVKKGDEIGLMYGAEQAEGLLPTGFDLSEFVKKGQRVFLFDGKIEAEVVSIVGKIVKIVCKNGGHLTSHKGINLPDTSFAGNALTEKDLADIEFVNKNDFDWVGLSFVHAADDVKALRKVANKNLKIISKIETRAAVEPEAMREIIKASDGVMVARGDMAYEVGPELVPVYQWQIIKTAQELKRKSIVATQMMASMVYHDRPTRAEVSDVARAVFEGADFTMLSEETAMGPYPVEAVAQMAKVIKVVSKNMAPGAK